MCPHYIGLAFYTDIYYNAVLSPYLRGIHRIERRQPHTKPELQQRESS